jgi:hypothetical protein
MEIIQELVHWTKPFFAMQIPFWVMLIIILLVFILLFIFKHRLVPYVSQLARNKADLKTIAERARLAEREKIRVQNESDAYRKIFTATLALDKILSDRRVMMHMLSGCGDSAQERGSFMMQLDFEVIGKWATDVSDAFGMLDDGELITMIRRMEGAAKRLTSICNPLDDLLQKNVTDKDREAAAIKRLEEHLSARKEWRLIVDSALAYTKRKLME